MTLLELVERCEAAKFPELGIAWSAGFCAARRGTPQLERALLSLESDYDSQTEGVLDDEMSDLTIEVDCGALFEIIQFMRRA